MHNDVEFGLSAEIINAGEAEKGKDSSVAINNKRKIVEIHEEESVLGWELWYHLGQTQQMDVSWRISKNLCNGYNPSVALNDIGIVVEVHEAYDDVPPEDYDLSYTVGKIEGNTIQWYEEREYDRGITPSIALNNWNWCIEVHKTQSSFSNKLWYRVGWVDEDYSIYWKKSEGEDSHHYDYGDSPQVAINNKGTVVEVHVSPGGEIHYKVGKIGENKIDWRDAVGLFEGEHPSIAIADNGVVIITFHKDGNLYKRVGSIDNESLSVSWFVFSSQFDTGVNCSVAVASDASMAIQTHQSDPLIPGIVHPHLWFSTSLVLDRERWMEKYYNTLRTKKLYQVTLPGSHDCGAYQMETNRTGCPGGVPEDKIPSYIPGALLGELIKPFAETQNLTFEQQLTHGARYFDLRPYQKEGTNETVTFYAYHDLIGADISVMLDKLAIFLQNTTHELVILAISHFCPENEFNHQELIDLITNKLENYLFNDTNVNLLETTIKQFVGQGSKVIVWYKDDAKSHNIITDTDGIWPYPGQDCDEDGFIYDCYANEDNYEVMVNDQKGKMKTYSRRCEKLFLLSWTLTFQPSEASIKKGLTKECIYNSISNDSFIGVGLRCLSATANRYLGKFLAKNVNKNNNYLINILFVDYLRHARVTDCAIMLNNIIRPVDLSVVKTASPTTVIAGQQLTYTVTVTNNGPKDATCVELTDIIEGDVFFNTVPPDCIRTGNRNTWVIGSLAAGESVMLIFIVTPTCPGTLISIATVEGKQEDPNPDNNTVTVTTNVLPAADLSVYKDACTTAVRVGDPLTYLVTVVNNGPSTATGVTLSNAFDGDTTDLVIESTEISQGSCGAVVDQDFTCTIGTMEPHEIAQLTVMVLPGVEGTLLNMARVTSDIHDPMPENNNANLIISVEPMADLSVVQTVTPLIGFLGKEIQYDITVTNNGPSDASGLIVEDTLPAGITVKSVVPYGLVSGNMVTWMYPSLPSGSSEKMTVTLTPNEIGLFKNSVSVNANETDPNLCNNSSITQFFVRSVTETDLSVTKSHSSETVIVCKPITFTIVVTNNGPEAATGVTLYEQIPSSMEVLSVNTREGGCATKQDKYEYTEEYRCYENICCDDDCGGHKKMCQQLQEIVCYLDSLAVGANATVEIVARPEMEGDFTNTAFVTANQIELNPSDNISTDTLTVHPTSTKNK
ncbi:MAG: DUF11 domain-containing protein [Firmicutes bacterium]|nr:DUF11 domain-containing protein [Bacillota bacterium]